MGIDTFCPLSGLHWYTSNTFIYALEDDIEELEELSTDIVALKQGLRLSEEDVKYSQSYAMICVGPPSKELNTVEDLLTAGDSIVGEYKCPREINETNTMEVFNLVAANSSEVDEFKSMDLTSHSYDGPACFLHHCFQTGVAVNYPAYLIFRHACPKILPHIFFRMHRDQLVVRNFDDDTGLYWGTFGGMEYGPTWGILEQYVDWCGLGKSCDDDNEVWPGLIHQKKPVQEILDDAWNGDGAMWTLVRPNNFPIDKAISSAHLLEIAYGEAKPAHEQRRRHLLSLPIEILLEIAKHLTPRQIMPLLSVSKNMRSSMVLHVNHLTYRYIHDHQPWLLPAGPVPFDDPRFGREEIDAWTEGWSKGGIDPERLKTDVPWFSYARACSNSMSMRSRQRIWGIAKQIEALAIRGNYID